MRVAKTIELDAQTDRELRVLSQRKRIEVRLQQRARIVLLAAKGMQNKGIALEVGLDRRQVALWRARFLEGGIDALRKDAPRSGRPANVMSAMESRIVQATLHERPANATHWSTRTLAEHLGIGATTVRTAWRRNGLKPHLSRTFKVSRDPRFQDKLLDVVGLYLNPPEHALVLSCDEKSQIQALNRTQPGLPMKAGRAGTVPRLQAARHDNAVCGAEYARWKRDLDVPAPSPAHRVVEVPAPDRPQDAQGPDAAPGGGQLRHAQPSRGSGLAGQAPSLRHALHPDGRLVAEHGRALLPRHHRQAHPARQLHQRA
jgi:transposase